MAKGFVLNAQLYAIKASIALGYDEKLLKILI